MFASSIPPIIESELATGLMTIAMAKGLKVFAGSRPN
jgi:hypothetical protein